MTRRQLLLPQLFLAGLAVLGVVFVCVRAVSRSGARRRTERTTSNVPTPELARLLEDPASRAANARRFGQERNPRAVPLLRGYSKDPDPSVREACVWALGQIADPEAVQAIRLRLFDDEGRVRLAAAAALARIATPPAAHALAEALDGDEPKLSLTAVEALGANECPEAVETLARVISSRGEAEMRAAAARALASRPDGAATEALVRALADREAAVRLAAIASLGGRKSGRALEGIASGVLDPDPSVRAEAAELAGKLGEEVLPHLQKALTRPASLEARRDALALVSRVGRGSAAALLRVLDTDAPTDAAEAARLRQSVVEALVAMGEKAIEPMARTAIEGRCGLLAKQAAAEACVRVGNKAAEPIVRHILAWNLFPDPGELKLWVRTLSEIGDERAVPALNRALGQGVPSIEELVAEARRKIESRCGRSLPPARPDPGVEIPRGPVPVPPCLQRPRKLWQGEPSSEIPDDGVVRLRLEGALVRADVEDFERARRDLRLRLTRSQGRWAPRLWGFAPAYNQSDHPGFVVEAKGHSPVRLRLELIVRDDPWTKGGYGTYELTLEPKGNALKGTYRGRYNYREVTGPAGGYCVALPPRRPVEPLASGEHPRLVFRRSALPYLRWKARTPVGRRLIGELQRRFATARGRALERGLDLAVGFGFLRALFGDEQYARAAVPIMNWGVENPGGGHVHDNAYKLIDMALAYDLVYDALSEAERQRFTRHIAAVAGIIRPYVGLMGNWNNGPNSNWTAIGCGGAGLAALAVLREEGPFDLPEPQEPGHVPVVIEPHAPGKVGGIPRNQLAGGGLLRNWLVAGPLPAGEGDPLARLGGCAGACPRPGVTFAVGAKTYKFAPLPGSAFVRASGFARRKERIVIRGATGESRSYLFCLLEVKGQQAGVLDCTFPLGYRGIRAWLSGREVGDGSLVILEPGLHRFLIELKGAVACPMFHTRNAFALCGLGQRYPRELQLWNQAKALWEKTGQRPSIPFVLDVAARNTRRWWQNAIGDHGWKTEPEGYHHNSLGRLLPFTVAYETVTGGSLWAGTGLPWSVPLELMRPCPSGGGGYSGLNASLSPHVVSYAMHLTAPALLPAAVWEFNRRFLDGGLDKLTCKDIILAFVHYPLDVEPRPSEEVMPRAIVDRRKGAFIFRDHYLGGDDIVTHMFFRSEQRAGPCYFHQQSGSFRISGLGAAWVIGQGGDKRNWRYEQENVVVIEGNQGRGLGKVIYFDGPPAGPWVVGADISGVYNHCSSLQVEASRHFAADYTGVSGAAALFAVVDRVHGGKRKTWLLHTTAGQIKVDGRSFTIPSKRDGASLNGIFLAPADTELRVSENTLAAACRAEKADFFVVMTLQRGKPPPPRTTGEGLRTVVTVGKRAIRFDGKKLILE